MKKYIFFSILFLMSSIVCVYAKDNYTLDYHYFSRDGNNFARLIGIKMTGPSDVLIPQTIENDGFFFSVYEAKVKIPVEEKVYLKSITFPNGLENISGGFNDCINLSSIIFGNNLKTIDSKTFSGCKSLDYIEIPKTVTGIGTEAFTGSGLKLAIINCCGEFYMFTNDSDFPIQKSHPLYNCTSLSTLVYTHPQAPKYWAATTRTYVPDKNAYSSPYMNLTSTPHIIEMISFSEKTFDYTGSVPQVTWTNNVEGYTATLDMSGLKADAGNHVDTILVTFTGEHPFVAKIPYKYTIKPVKLKAKVNNIRREYGDENPQFNITYSGFINGDDENVITTKPIITTYATRTSNVGEYPIIISGGSATNYELVYEPGVLTITKAPLSAKVNDETKVYGSKNPVFTLEYYGLKNEETAPAWTTRPSFQTDATQSSNVGQYDVKAMNGVPVNYNLGEITSGKLTITPAQLTIKANDATRQYYTENPLFTYSCSGFMDGDDESKLSSQPVLSTTATLKSGVGTYVIKVSDVASQNYSISNINGTLTVTPRTLIASVGNYERYYNEENPAFKVKYDGFAGNEDEKVLSSKAIANTTATKNSDVGAYPINVTGGSADNYKLSYMPGLLTINKAEQTISWNQDLSDLKVGDQIEMKAFASSGLPITYTMDSNGAAEIYSAGSKTYLDCIAGGQFLIRAVQNGNKNYYSSPRATNAVSIFGNNASDPVLTIQQADNGTISTQVQKRSTYTFTISPSNGWRIHSVTFNNTDVTNQLTNNTFTTPSITSNSMLSVVYQLDDNAVNSARESRVKIQATSYGVRVIDANIGDMIRIYTTDGCLQHSVKADSHIVDIPLEKNDVYIVNVSGKTLKLSH